MFRALNLLVLVGLVLMVGACAPAEEGANTAAQGSAEFAALTTAKQALDSKRAELAAATAGESDEEAAEGEAGEGEASEGDESGDGEESAEAEPPDLDQLQKDVNALAANFGEKLVDYINSQGISVGAEFTPEQRNAMDMKAEEDMIVAQEYIDKGGDYARAINIYVQALVYDPANQVLLDAKAKAESDRYMTEERFAGIEKDMSQDEVRALVGIPKRENIREFDNGIIGWYYPKEEPRTAAGVFFQEKRDELTVYKTDFNAIESEIEVRESDS